MAFSGTGHRLGSEWGSDFVGEDSHPVGMDLISETTSTVPSLREICLSTLDRYSDLLEDLGETPYYLIESVLKKCNVKQLSRIEEHTEGLAEMTDELWYFHAINKYKSFRQEYPTYDESGEWRSKYEAKEQEELKRFERERAKLRESYSQHDKARQVRRVIVDPTLRLPKKTIRPAGLSSSGWSNTAPRKNNLIEKARADARKITQMYKSIPYPPPKSRTYATNTPTNIRRPIPPPSFASTRHAIAPTSLFANQEHIPLGSAAAGIPARSSSSSLSTPSSTLPVRPRVRYNYKVRPVVYTTTFKPVLAQSSSTQTSPTRPKQGHGQISPTAPGAIADFFNQINPIHTRNSTSSRHDPMEENSQSRSPTSPVQPASKTIQMLRETPMPSHTALSSSLGPKSGHSYERNHGLGVQVGPKTVKNDGDFKWLEDDNDDDDHHVPSKRPTKRSEPGSNDAPKKTLSEKEAAKMFFNSLASK